MTNNCCICLEDIETKDELFETSCGHHFHKGCFGTWYDAKQSCPLCRNDKNERSVIYYKSNLHNLIYYFINLNDRPVVINGYSDKDVRVNLFNRRSCPTGWIIDTWNPYPLFTLDTPDSPYQDSKITLFLRLMIIFSKSDRNIEMVEKKDRLGNKYYDADCSKNPYVLDYFINQKDVRIIYDWIFDVIKEMRLQHNFDYPSIMNPLIFDVFIMTLLYFELSNQKSKYQTIVASSIYSVIKYTTGVEISIPKLRWYTDLTSREEDISFYSSWQSNEIFAKRMKRIKSASVIRELYRI